LILAYNNCQKRHYDKTFQRLTVSGAIRQSSKGDAVFRRRMTLRSKGVVAAALAACILALLGALLAASSGAAGTPAASTSTDGVINVATPTASQLSVVQSAALKQAASAEHTYADGGMCLSRNTSPYPALGNINFGTC
jgi:hypothetical protein